MTGETPMLPAREQTAIHICRIDRHRCTRLDEARTLEWIVTNGRGGFAMGSVAQILTRRYHGLLVAAIDPPVERYVLLAKLDAFVTIRGKIHHLAANEYIDIVRPKGYKLLESFTTLPYPTWRWRVEGVTIEQTLCMVEDEDTTFVRFRVLDCDEPVALTVRPFCASRHFHHLDHRDDLAGQHMDVAGDRLAFYWPGDRPTWQLSHNGKFDEQPGWFFSFFLRIEHERDYDKTQDLFTPGVITATLQPGDDAGLVFAASTQDRAWRDWPNAFDRSALADGKIAIAAENAGMPTDDPLTMPLLRATRDFLVVRDGDLKTVIAGYPWFGDWGRDTFISLPGLCLVPGRFDDARRIIQAFAKHVDQGMIPNRFPDFGEAPAYNTVDATLWYVHAIDRYLTYTGDWEFVADTMFPVIADILAAYDVGTRHGIRLCDDGLITQGEEGLALTWMDAKLQPDRAITPRIGKAVEINALWYNALRIAASYAQRMGNPERAGHWTRAADRARSTFNQRFWNEVRRCLFDVVDVDGQDDENDPAVRPNQLFAISLTHPVLDEARWDHVVRICEKELWTPIGLRTLSPNDRAYCPRYEGDLESRDEAYHQGTVWPWLLGPFITAYVKAAGLQQSASSGQRSAVSSQLSDVSSQRPESNQRAPGLGQEVSSDVNSNAPGAVHAKARGFLDGLLPHLNENGIGSIVEVADGDPPHSPGGCPWQAWSVAEPLRALCEDIHRPNPTVV
ncbi:MAG: amylo-alpha-1,6-glucosidase [Planctomycetota bacterium]